MSSPTTLASLLPYSTTLNSSKGMRSTLVYNEGVERGPQLQEKESAFRIQGFKQEEEVR